VERRREWGGGGASSEALLVLHIIEGITLISSLLVHILRYIESYQNYINYLEDIAIYNFKWELGEALACLDPPSSEDDGPVTGPMVFKTDTSCEDEYCTYRCHEKKNTTLHQLLHPHHLHPISTPAWVRVLHALPTLQHSGGSLFSGHFYR
jgi:hypothetical protein